MSDQLVSLITVEQFAELAGIQPASVRKYVKRGVIPAPDGRFGFTDYWQRSTVDNWLANRPRFGRPPKLSAPAPSEGAGA